MSNFIASCVFGILDPLLAIPASLTTQLIDYYNRPPAQLDQGPDTTLSECVYRLDRSTQSTLSLPNARVISYSQYGSTQSTAKTIFFLHGFPGAGVEATHLDSIAQKHDIRVIGIDRPAFGNSTPDLKRTILSHANDVETVAEHLNVKQYGVLGVSGGGPYALACAKVLPAEKLKIVGIVCGLGPADIGYRGMFLPNYLGWTLSSRYGPMITKWFFSREPAARLDLSRAERIKLLIYNAEKQKSKLNPKDVPFLTSRDVMRLQIRCGEDAHTNGMDYVYQDMNLLASDPGFRVEDIRKDLKFRLWYGKEDGNVPFNHGVQVEKRLKSGSSEHDPERVKLKLTDDDTHISIFFDHREEVLTEMIKAL